MLSGWTKYKDSTITGTSAGAQSNYQVKVTVVYEADMISDFSDIRFTDTSDNIYDHWLQEKTDSTSAVFWVEIPSVPASPSTTTLRMQYGNSGASSASDGDATFLFFDDFNGRSFIDPDKWRKVVSGGYIGSIDSATLMLTGDGDQGLAADGTYLYHGRNTGTGTNSEIYVYDYAGVEIAASPFTGPPHCSGIDIREDHDTLIAGSGSSSEDPVLWEINKATGTLIRSWDFSSDSLFLDGAGLVAYKSENTVYVHASDSTNFRILELTINDNGTYTVIDYWTATLLGTPQGLDYVDGHLYYLYDVSTTAFRVDSLNLVGSGGGSISVANSKNISGYVSSTETEGLAWDGSNWFFGDVDGRIKKLIASDELNTYAPASVSKTAMAYSLSTFTVGKAVGFRAKVNNHYPMFGLTDAAGAHPSDGDCLILGKLSAAQAYLKSRRKESGVLTDVGYTSITGYATYDSYEIQWKSEAVQFFNAGISLDSGWLTGNVPGGPLYVGVGGNTSTATDGWSTDVDCVYLRNFVDAEPTVGSWGDEQSAISPINGTLGATVGLTASIAGKLGIGGGISTSAGDASLVQAGQEGKQGDMSSIFENLLASVFGVPGISGGFSSVLSNNLFASAGQQGNQGTLSSQVSISAMLFGIGGDGDVIVEGSLASVAGTIGTEIFGKVGNDGTLAGQVIMAASLAGQLGSSGSYTIQLDGISSAINGILGISGDISASVSAGGDLAGKLGLSAEFISTLGDLGLQLIEIIKSDRIYQIIISTTTGQVVFLSPRTGTVDIITST